MAKNTNLVLISGKSATGKTASLKDLNKPEGVIYLNCENNKELPFKTKFESYTITDPNQVYEAFAYAETKPHIHTIVIDTLDYLMEMFETLYIATVADTQKAWGKYGQYFRKLMSQDVAKSSKNVIFLAHTFDKLNETDMAMETFVKVKGAIMNQGVESFFSTVISTKKVSLKQLEGFESPMLNISEEDKELGYKHVFQTRLTKETIGERIRSSIGMWDKKETFIDNNAQMVINKLHDYYK